MRETGVILTSQWAAQLSTAVLAVLLARHLGPSTFGLFAGFVGASQALAVLVEGGLTIWLLRELTLAGETEAIAARKQRAFTGAVWTCVGLGTVLTVVGLAAALATTGGSASAFALGGLLAYSSCISVCLVLETTFRARRAVKMVAAATAFEKLLLVGGVGLVVVLGGGLAAIAAAYAVAGVGRLLFDAAKVARAGTPRLTRPDASVILPTARSALPFSLNAAAVVMVVRLDVVLVALVSTHAAAYYSIADRVLGVLLVLPSVAGSTLFPHLSTAADRRRDAFHAGTVVTGVVAVLTVAAIVVAPHAVPFIFGEPYKAAVPVVQIMLVGAPLAAFSNILLTRLFSEGQERRVVAWTASVMATGIPILLVGVLAMGARGAALAYVLRGLLFTATMAVIARARQAPELGR